METQVLVFGTYALIQKYEIKYEVILGAPSTFNEVVNHRKIRGLFGITPEGASPSIYGDVKHNYAARALHDFYHVKLHKDFSLDDEYVVARYQRGEMYNILRLNGFSHGVSKKSADLLFDDIVLQIQYYYKTGRYVEDQVAFMKLHSRNYQ